MVDLQGALGGLDMGVARNFSNEMRARRGDEGGVRYGYLKFETLASYLHHS